MIIFLMQKSLSTKTEGADGIEMTERVEETEGVDGIENTETVEKTERVDPANTTDITVNTDVDKTVVDPSTVLSIPPDAALIPSKAALVASAMPPPPSLSLAPQLSSLVGLVHCHAPELLSKFLCFLFKDQRLPAFFV